MLIEQFLNSLENAYEKDAKTIKSYRINLNEFKQYMFSDEEVTVEKLAVLFPDDILIDWLNSVKDSRGLSASSLNQRISALRAFYDWLRIRRLIPFNIAKDIPLYKQTKKKGKRVPSIDECMHILEQVENMVEENRCYDTLRTRLAINLFLGAGLRITECCNLLISDFNKEEGKLYIHNKVKYSKEREIFIPEQIFTMLNEYLWFRNEKNDKLDESLHDNLFISKHNKVLSDQMMRIAIYKVFDSCNIHDVDLSGLDIHSLRHAYASLMASSNCPMHKLSNGLGHANINTTSKIYVKQDDENISKYNPLFNKKVKNNIGKIC